MFYRKKSDVKIEAYPWCQNGDHPEDRYVKGSMNEGALVRRYRHPSIDGLVECEKCGFMMHDHGWIDSEMTVDPNGETVCPGSYVLNTREPHPIHGHLIICYRAIGKKEFEETYTKDNQ